MAKAHYDEAKVLRSVQKKGININSVTKTIEIPTNQINIGNSTWGKIDYLTNYCGYVYIKVDTKQIFEEREEQKKQKRKLAKQVKAERKAKQLENVKHILRKTQLCQVSQ